MTTLLPDVDARSDDGAQAERTEAAERAHLVARLRAALGPGGAGCVDDARRRRAEYSTDASNYRVVPQVVLFPRDADDVAAAAAACRDLGVPLTSRGGGTSVAGNAVGTGVVLDHSRHLGSILSLDVAEDGASASALVQPGVVLDDLMRAADPAGWRFGPDPSTHSRATLGGMIGNDACGSHALAYGRTSDNVLALEVLDGHGRRWWTDDAPTALVDPLAEIGQRNLGLLRTSFGTFGRQVSGYALENLLPERQAGGRAGRSADGPATALPAPALSGRSIARLLTGSEGTLATTLAARVRLVRQSAAAVFVVLGYPDMATAADGTPALLEHHPLAVEGIDRRLVDVVRARGRAADGLPAGEGWLFVEVGGSDAAGALAAAHALVADARRHGAVDDLVVTDAARARALWRVREDGAGFAGRSPTGAPAWPGWEDAAVPPARLGAYLRDFGELTADHGVDGLAYGHFGDGCIHVRLDLPLSAPGGAARSRAFLEDAARLVASHGGSLSGEHGDGRARGALLPLMYPPEAIAAFEAVKAVFDPADVLNPGVIVRPRPLAADLRVPSARVAVSIGRRAPTTDAPGGRGGGAGSLGFAYPHDGGDLTQAVHRCVGVGKCRADSGGVMCPSYLATGDEKDSTRARARLLQEMANGSLVETGWSSPEVAQSLDLCLSCKGCASDCPAGVDMATYKAEFLDHHWRGRLRPRSHYLLGWLPRWSRLAVLAPGLVNACLRLPGAARAARALGGVDRRRPLPRFAAQPFRAWFAARPGRDRRWISTGATAEVTAAGAPAGTTTDGAAVDAASAVAPGRGQPVVLWVDSFTQAFDPAVGRAAVTLLEHLGFAVTITRRQVCCGLTWVSTGQLDGAKRQLHASLDALEEATSRALAGTGVPAEGADGTSAVPIVGLEPSCTALLREDAARLLPDDGRARALHERVRTVAELIAEHRPGWQPPDLRGDGAGGRGDAVVQPHCHQHAVMGFGPDQALLARAGLDPQVLSGCCGLAGNFGAEAGHHEVSVKVAEHALLPALERVATAEAAGEHVPVVADGFSCRTQSADLAGRRPVHLVELLAAALPPTRASDRPETATRWSSDRGTDIPSTSESSARIPTTTGAPPRRRQGRDATTGFSRAPGRRAAPGR